MFCIPFRFAKYENVTTPDLGPYREAMKLMRALVRSETVKWGEMRVVSSSVFAMGTLVALRVGAASSE